MTISEIKDRGLLLLECITGSRAYGLATEKSDTDLKGVYYLPKKNFYGLNYVAQVNNETNDEVYYELGRFTELLIRNNPNILEMLATPDEMVLYRHPIMNNLHINLFLSRLCKESFAGYALTQIKKARGYNKKIVKPVDKERKSVTDFCFVMQEHASVPLRQWLLEHELVQERCGLTSIPHAKGLYALFYDYSGNPGYKGIVSNDAANDVSLSSVPKGTRQIAYLFFNKESYSAYCKEYREYWDWVQKRNDDRYLGNVQHGKGYDAKNMMHTIRLLQEALELLSTGRLQVWRANREELLAIKAGQFDYEDLLEMADQLMQKIELAANHSPLPAEPDANRIESVLIAMRKELYG